jgi:hypothetical protein
MLKVNLTITTKDMLVLEMVGIIRMLRLNKVLGHYAEVNGKWMALGVTVRILVEIQLRSHRCQEMNAQARGGIAVHSVFMAIIEEMTYLMVVLSFHPIELLFLQGKSLRL